MLHTQQMLHYPAVNAENNVTDDLKEYVSFSEYALYPIEELWDVREENGLFELFVRWEDWEENEDATWELFFVMRDDVPDMVLDLLLSSGNSRVKENLLNADYS